MNRGKGNMLAVSIANTTAAITVADVKVPCRKRRRLTTGEAAVSSRKTKATNDTAATAEQAVITFESNQSSRCPSSSTYWRVETKTHMSTMPAASKFFFCATA